MNEMNNSPNCERASDLIAFVYDETNESERRDFELHLKQCANCHQEVESFGIVRESITAWRDEALSGFVSTPLAATAKKKSALAALREFFDLSPLWLKGATGFAVVAFCVLAAVAFMNVNTNERGDVASVPEKPHAVYTQADVDKAVKEALAKYESSRHPQPEKEPVTIVHSQQPKKAIAPQSAKSRRPLTRAEREQLAAELRLLADDDDAGLNLLGDRINQ
jgi:hypothetical protein